MMNIIETGLRVSKSRQQIVITVIPVMISTLIPSVGLKICIGGVLQKPRKKPLSPFVEQGMEVLPEMNGQITVEETLLATGL